MQCRLCGGIIYLGSFLVQDAYREVSEGTYEHRNCALREGADAKPAAGHHTGRCGKCGSDDLWEDNLAYGCRACGATLGEN